MSNNIYWRMEEHTRTRVSSFKRGRGRPKLTEEQKKEALQKRKEYGKKYYKQNRENMIQNAIEYYHNTLASAREQARLAGELPTPKRRGRPRKVEPFL